MKEFDSVPTCCEDCTAAECDSCEGLDENCPEYQRAMAGEDRIQQRFNRDHSAEIAAQKVINWDNLDTFETEE